MKILRVGVVKVGVWVGVCGGRSVCEDFASGCGEGVCVKGGWVRMWGKASGVEKVGV